MVFLRGISNLQSLRFIHKLNKIQKRIKEGYPSFDISKYLVHIPCCRLLHMWIWLILQDFSEDTSSLCSRRDSLHQRFSSVVPVKATLVAPYFIDGTTSASVEKTGKMADDKVVDVKVRYNTVSQIANKTNLNYAEMSFPLSSLLHASGFEHLSSN